MTTTTLILPGKNEPKLEFPLLAKSNLSKRVVQFKDETTARILLNDDGTQCIDNNAGWNTFINPVNQGAVWTILPRGTKIVIEQL